MNFLDSEMEMLWHYTVTDKAIEILENEGIEPVTGFVCQDDRPAVWFSANQVWDNGFNCAVSDPLEADGERAATKEEMIEMYGGLMRFGVVRRIAPYNLEEYIERAGIDPQVANILATLGKAHNYNPNEWWSSFHSVHEDFWSDIQIWNVEKNEWESITQRKKKEEKFLTA